jgi:signal peptidase
MKLKLLKVVALLAVPLALLATCALCETGQLPYKVYIMHTGSMSPTIPPRSAVVVRERTYRVGEVISFIEDGNIVTHRLVAVNPNGTTDTKGDANSTIDPWHVPTSDIIGSVVAAPRMVGFLLVYIRSPLGDASILIASLCMWEMWSLAKASDLARTPKLRPVTCEPLVSAQGGHPAGGKLSVVDAS